MKHTKQWGVFVVLALVVLGLLIGMELQTDEGTDSGWKPVHLTTRTPTATRTVGWWVEVATWTPTATGEATGAAETATVQSTPTPELNLPPVKTLAQPSPKPTWTRRP